MQNHLVKMVGNCGIESYCRGAEDGFAHPLMKEMYWELGYLNSLQMIKDKKLRSELMTDIHPQNRDFYSVVFSVWRQSPLSYLLGFLMRLDWIYKIKFIVFSFPILFYAYICYARKWENDISLVFFHRIKIRIWSNKWAFWKM